MGAQDVAYCFSCQVMEKRTREYLLRDLNETGQTGWPAKYWFCMDKTFEVRNIPFRLI